MTKPDPSPKIWRDNPGRHFNPWYQEAEVARRLHERGLETKTRVSMGKRWMDHRAHERQSVTLHASHAPITLPTLKWMSKS